MSLRIRFRFDGRCSIHPRYNPEKDGSPQHKNCPGCDSLWVIHLYCRIARRKAEAGEGILVTRPNVYPPEPATAASDIDVLT
jgi:hypothetical protein